MIRSACGFVALLALLLQGSSGGHMLLVQHTRCAQHGELVHDAEAHDHGASSGVEAGLVVMPSMSDEASDEAHGHCALTADRRSAAHVIAAAELSPLVVELQSSFTSLGLVIPFDAQRFRVAPKNSPPA
jgi:hypothetical protein